MRVRRIGIEAAMMVVAGSAVPKMKRSTVVAAVGGAHVGKLTSSQVNGVDWYSLFSFPMT
jgi:hypothetical protein